MAMSDDEYIRPQRPPVGDAGAADDPAERGIPVVQGTVLPPRTLPGGGDDRAGGANSDGYGGDVAADADAGDSDWSARAYTRSSRDGSAPGALWTASPDPGQVYRPTSAMKIGIWGAPGSGKTTYLGALNFACANADPRIGQWRMAPCDEKSKQLMDDLVQRLVLGTYPDPNNVAQYQDFRWNLAGSIENSRYAPRKRRRHRVPEESEFDIELVDASGEVFGTDPSVPEVARKRALDHLEASDGLLFLFDPITERDKPSVASYAANVLSRLLLRAQETGRRDGRFLPYRVAVCITKTDDRDLLWQARKAGLVFADSDGVERVPDSMAKDLFDAICDGQFWDRGENDQLSTAGAVFVRDQLKVHFRPGNIRYYAISAVGHQTPNFQEGRQRLHGPIKPFNVLEPLVELHMQLTGRA
jgi:hypothetical protein